MEKHEERMMIDTKNGNTYTRHLYVIEREGSDG